MTTGEKMNDLLRGLAEIDQAHELYEKAHDYYEGCVDEVFASNRLRALLGRGGERYHINFAKTAVNVVADRLEIAAVSVPGDDAATRILQERVWDANELLLETPEATRLACVYGDYYIVVWPSEVDGRVDVWFNAPTSTRVIYDVENPRKKAYAIKRWQEGKRVRANLYYPDRIERWITTTDGADGSADHMWMEYVDDGQAWPTPNPYGEVPVFHLRTNSPYGVPEHRDAYGPQDALTKMMITMVSANDYAGFPMRYALTDPNAVLDGDANIRPPWDDETEAAEAQADRGKLTTAPGNIWMLNGLKGVGQFDPADPKHFLDPMEFLIRAMAQVTTTPLHYFDPSGDVPSGESLRTADAPLVKKIRYRQMRFGATYAEALAFALKILGRADAKVDVRWTPATSTDDQDAWATAKLKIDAGVPVRQVLLEAGYTAEQIDGWIATNGEDNLAQRVVLLANLGKAAQALGAAISLGAISAEAAQQAVAGILEPVITGEALDDAA
jgi:hypothetical protein